MEFILFYYKRMTFYTKCNVFKVAKSCFHYGVVIGKGPILFLQCIFGKAITGRKNLVTGTTLSTFLPIHTGIHLYKSPDAKLFSRA